MKKKITKKKYFYQAVDVDVTNDRMRNVRIWLFNIFLFGSIFFPYYKYNTEFGNCKKLHCFGQSEAYN
jgi:hypothetical protein